MTQEAMMTKPVGDAQPSNPSDQQRSRRRLGDWQAGGDATNPLAYETGFDYGSIPAPDLSTAPFQAAQSAFQTVPFGTAEKVNGFVEPIGEATAQFDARFTAPIAPSTAPIAPVSGEWTTPLPNSGAAATAPKMATQLATAEMSATAAIGQHLDATAHIATPTAPISAATAPIQSSPNGSATTEMGLASTAPINGVTAQIAGQQPSAAATAPMAATGSGELAQEVTELVAQQIDELRVRVRQNPDDSDALFELSVLLHRVGLRNDARDVLTQLVALYEQRGQHQQAARIKGMLGTPKTGTAATEDTGPRATAATQPIQNRTVPLASPTAAIGKAKEAAKAQLDHHAPAFPPESLIFTMPLPGEEKLNSEARSLLRQADAELKARQLQAAFDTSLQVIAIAPDFAPIYLRLAEIYTKQRLTRRARMQAEALIRLANATDQRESLWMVYRVLLHASESDTTSLRRLVELLIDAGQTNQASLYASRLIQILDGEGLTEEALAYSVRLCEIIPGDTRAALENAILRLKGGDRGGALDRWEHAVSTGADPIVARSSLAAVTTSINEDDHWRLLADVIPALRVRGDREIVDAYVRTASVMPESPTLIAGQGLILTAAGDIAGRELLVQAAGARSGAAFSRAAAAVALAWSLADQGNVDEYVAAVRTALKLLQDDTVAAHPGWEGLLGRVPRFEDLSLELGEALLQRGDAAGAAEVLKEAHSRTRHHGPISERLSEAYFKIGQLGSALTVLDELAVHYRASGQLEAMAGVLRQMSQLAPNNIKVKSRLIDAYLQRGFVAEARAELIQRADLEERSGLIKDAVTSLQRAADLSWTIGLADETFSLYGRVIAMAPDDVGNRSALVNFYLQMGRLSEAAEHQRAVVDIALRENHKHEAIAALHQVIGLTPDDTSAYYQLADLLASMGEYHQSEKVYRRLVLMNPADAIAQAKATSMAALRESKAE